MRTRSRLLLSFVGGHLLLSLAMGLVAYRWLDATLHAQAQESARTLGRVIAQGHFLVTPEVANQLRDLTGYQFRILPDQVPLRPGTVQVVEEGKVVEVEYLNATYEKASSAVIGGTVVFILIGVCGFGLMGLVISHQFARPVEVLAKAAQTIGSGDLEARVALVGSGEIVALARELEFMRTRLRDLDAQHRKDERLATIGTFTATIAHEVRNPLTAVKLTVQLLTRRPSKETQDASINLIIEELERLDLIIDELLAFSKGMQVQPVPIELRDVASGVVKLLRRQAEHAQVDLMVEGSATVMGDPARLRQLLMNLLLNAIQAHQGRDRPSARDDGGNGQDDHGMVKVQITPDGWMVSDDGPGVPVERVADMFEAFSSTRPGGAGLGLHLARSIAIAHGGTLKYRPLPLGSCFTLEGLKPVNQRGSL